MDVRAVLNNFATIAEAPSGLQHLRSAILSLAFSGRLVAQDPTDASAATLISRPAAPKSGSVVEDPTLPAGWILSRFDQVSEARLGRMLDRARNTGPYRPYLRNANVQWFRFDLDDVYELQVEAKDLPECSVTAGDLLVCEGGEPGRSAVCDVSVEGMVIQKALHRVRPRPGVDPWYLAYLLRYLAVTDRLAPYFTGATIKHLTGRSFARVPVPLAPAREQTRIVAKIDELMGLCDELEALQASRRLATRRFRTSALHALTAARTAEDLTAAWMRVSSNLHVVVGSVEGINEIRQTIVNLALSGRLTASQHGDGDVASLLQHIRSDGLDSPDVVDRDGRPLANLPALPATWRWVAFGSLLRDIQAGWSAPSLQRPSASGEWGVLKVSACSWGSFRGVRK